MLQAAHIEEGEYFSRRVHEDIDIIMKDLREAHSGRSDSASEVTVVDELKKDMEEEKQWLIRIAQKSELSKSHIPQRGKKC